MSLDDANTQLDLGCDHKKTVCCHCRPDIFNGQTPGGVGFCYSPSAPNSANFTPVDNTNQSYADWNRAMRAGGGHSGYLITNAYQTPEIASTASSGPGRSGAQPIQEQPGQTTPMRDPVAQLSAYGTIVAGYAGLPRSPTSVGSNV
ncbi:hypothetical protein SLS53_001460 [Cytospora paraplurivora]|uniref:Uncharacterized protein n=1 Tax=Cytospora paraplurivora TaxID=2898453 RepID=A0AAN9YMW8_9PEZI